MASHFTLPGKVYLTAIGPGPAKRLTLRTLELLRRADLVVHDGQVPEDVLELVPPHVAVVRMTQELESNARTCEEIRRRMAEGVRKGQCVVRLIFAGIPSDRDAQQEITTLREAGIEAEFLPGILYSPAEAGAPRNPLPLGSVHSRAAGNFESLVVDLRPSTEISAD